jgi:hypothetical protein
VTSALVIGLVWLALAMAVALVLGGAIGMADVRDEQVRSDLRDEVDAVLAGLEADLRAAAASPPAL